MIQNTFTLNCISLSNARSLEKVRPKVPKELVEACSNAVADARELKSAASFCQEGEGSERAQARHVRVRRYVVLVCAVHHVDWCLQVHAVREADVGRHQGCNARLERRECNERVRRQVAGAVRAAEGGVEQQEQAVVCARAASRASAKDVNKHVLARCVHVTR